MHRSISFRLGVAALVGLTSAAYADTFMVTTSADDGPGSLRSAIAQSNMLAPGPNTITITISGTIQLASGLPVIATPVVIDGPGAAQLTIRGNHSAPVITISTSFARVSGVTLSNGGGGIDPAGGIMVRPGDVELDDVTITGNSNFVGAGIFSSARLTLRHCSVIGNSGGSAIYASGKTFIDDSTIADNAGTAIVFDVSNELSISRSTISGNTTLTGIGGIELRDGSAAIRNSTFSNNSGPLGGDFWTQGDGVFFHLINVTSTSAGPALRFDHASDVDMHNTIFVGPGVRCAIGATAKPLRSGGNNLASDASCDLSAENDRVDVVDALLGPLADNGGPTWTHLPLTDSPAIDSGNSTGLTATDQRGRPRIAGVAQDIGAVEVDPPVVDVDAGVNPGVDAGIDPRASDAGCCSTSSPAPAGTLLLSLSVAFLLVSRRPRPARSRARRT